MITIPVSGRCEPSALEELLALLPDGQRLVDDYRTMLATDPLTPVGAGALLQTRLDLVCQPVHPGFTSTDADVSKSASVLPPESATSDAA
jgi:hypothetical protein